MNKFKDTPLIITLNQNIIELDNLKYIYKSDLNIALKYFIEETNLDNIIILNNTSFNFWLNHLNLNWTDVYNKLPNDFNLIQMYIKPNINVFFNKHIQKINKSYINENFANLWNRKYAIDVLNNNLLDNYYNNDNIYSIPLFINNDNEIKYLSLIHQCEKQPFIVNDEGMGMIWGWKCLSKILSHAFPEFEIIKDEKLEYYPNLIIKGVFNNAFQMKDDPYSLNNKIPYIIWSGESSNWKFIYKSYNPIAIFSTYIDSNNEYYYLPYITYANYNLSNIKEYINNKRPYTCCLCSSHYIPFREQMFKLIQKYDKNGQCHLYGKGLDRKPIEGEWTTVYHKYKDYKFVLAMENKDEKRYITEKIMNAYMGGAIPIYWGSDGMIDKIFNPKSFIDIKKFKTPEECAKYIYKLSKDKQELKRIQNEPIFLNNKISEYLDLDSNYYKNMAYSFRIKYDKFFS